MPKRRVHIAPLVVVMLLVARCTLADSVDDYLRQQMKEKHIPGAVLIELKDGKLIKQQSYGVANVELDVPMRDSNVFLIASITKVFVATAVFLLVQDGKLTVNDKITQVVPGLPEAWSDITLLNCLSHTSGIPDIVRYRPGGFQWLAGTQEEALKLLSSMPLEHKPGEKSGYNGTEFLIVKMIVEKVSGMRLQDFLAKPIFEPLHMESARYGDTLDIIPNRASLYTTYSPSDVDPLSTYQMPTVDAAMLLFGSYGRRLLLLIAVVGVISTVNAGLMYTPRILFSMSRDGLLPRNITSVNRGGTPSLALFLCAIASIALVLSGSFDTLIAIGSVLYVAVYLSGFASLLILRRSEPDLPRPYKAWRYPWSTVLVLLASAAFLLGSVIGDLKHSLFTAVLILLSYVASILIVREKGHQHA